MPVQSAVRHEDNATRRHERHVEVRYASLARMVLTTAALLSLVLASGDDVAACTAGKQDACVRAAKTAENEKRWPDWKDLLAKACELRHGASCQMRAELADDMAVAGSFRDKGCRAGDLLSCELYGKQLQQGYGVKKDEKAGTALVQKACKGGQAGACRTLALAEPSVPKRLKLLEQACSGGDLAVSCLLLGDHYAEVSDLVRATAFWTKACSGTQPKACAKAGIPVPVP